jgi:hypothetical protein
MANQGNGSHLAGRVLRLGGLVGVGAALLLAVVWPWPAPAVAWQQPLESAIARGDCPTVNALIVELTTAGAKEVLEYQSRMAETGVCANKDLAKASTLRDYKRSYDRLASYPKSDWRPRTERDELVSVGWSRDLQISFLNFVCIAPYDALTKVDHARLVQAMRSKGVEADLNFWHDLHVERRTACVNLVNGLIRDLLSMETNEANTVAYELFQFHISYEVRGANSMYAELVLGRGFKRSYASTDSIHTSRASAWSHLEVEAGTGHLLAVELMMKYLHAGRYHHVDDRAAYFWGLRLRRLGGDPGKLFESMAARLTPEERALIQEKERSHSYP